MHLIISFRISSIVSLWAFLNYPIKMFKLVCALIVLVVVMKTEAASLALNRVQTPDTVDVLSVESDQPADSVRNKRGSLFGLLNALGGGGGGYGGSNSGSFASASAGSGSGGNGGFGQSSASANSQSATYSAGPFSASFSSSNAQSGSSSSGGGGGWGLFDY